jgi:hypothetical protein
VKPTRFFASSREVSLNRDGNGITANALCVAFIWDKYRVLHKFEEDNQEPLAQRCRFEKRCCFDAIQSPLKGIVRSTQSCGGLLRGQQSLLNKHDHTNWSKGQT